MEKEIKPISRWEECTLAEYFKIQETLKGDTTEEERVLNLFAILSRRSDFENLTITEAVRSVPNFDFLNDEVPLTPIDSTITIGGKEWQLCDGKHGREVTVAQFVDFQNLVKIEEAKRDAEWHARIVSTAIKHPSVSYAKRDHDALVDALETAPITMILSVERFFFLKYQQLSPDTAAYFATIQSRERISMMSLMAGVQHILPPVTVGS